MGKCIENHPFLGKNKKIRSGCTCHKAQPSEGRAGAGNSMDFHRGEK